MTDLTPPKGEPTGFDLETRIAQLEIAASWKENLQERIALARLRFELIGLDPEEQDHLVDEVQEFKRLCRAIAWPRRRLTA
jgi:hypothetical protein